MITLSASGWGRDVPIYRDVFTNTFIPDASPEQRDWFNELQRITCSPENAVRLQRALGPIDVTHLLPSVSVPALILHARGDLRCPFEEGRMLASGIRGSRFASLDSRNHILLEHEPAWSSFLQEFRTFLGVDSTPTEPAAPEPPSFVGRLRQNRVGQWGLAYLTAAWLALQLLGEVSEPWGLAPWVLRGGQVALVFGFVLTLVVAWNHGRRGKQHLGKAEVALVSAVVIVFLIALVVLAR
ncbi:MAG TPA: hypothetical protein VMM17_03790 [Gemmatimonadaceae bacterium]|nr:hypothetical protein [Gemmatimonadaceae bacterium]